MTWISTRQLISVLGGILIVLLLVPGVSLGSQKDHAYRHSDLDIPVSLAAGSVRTPEFPVVGQWYDIMVQVEKPLPFLQMQCMMGVTASPLVSKDCGANDPLLQAQWTVWDGDHIVDKGSNPTRCACKFENKYIFKFLGSFVGERGKKYLVEVKFTKDGTPLNVANPHLIVIKHKDN
jgi:hypothetical protein